MNIYLNIYEILFFFNILIKQMQQVEDVFVMFTLPVGWVYTYTHLLGLILHGYVHIKGHSEVKSQVFCSLSGEVSQCSRNYEQIFGRIRKEPQVSRDFNVLLENLSLVCSEFKGAAYFLPLESDRFLSYYRNKTILKLI